MNRHDIPVEVKAVIEEAIEVGVIDPAEVYVMAIKFGNDWSHLIDDVIEAAWSWHHSEEGRSMYYRVVDKAEAFWMKVA